MGFGPSRNRRYSERHEQEMISLYRSGLSLAGVERETGVPGGTVWDILVRNDVARRPNSAYSTQEPLDPILLTRTVWLHEQGLTYDQIGEIMGIGRGGVRHRLRIARDSMSYTGINRGKNNRPKKAMPLHVLRAVRAWEAEDELEAAA